MRQVSFICICLFICLVAPVEPSTQPPPKKVMIISDPQYGWCRLDSCKYERRNFRKIVDIVNEEKFDVLIILGDLVESIPSMRESHANQVRLFLEDLKRIKSARLYLLAGNHDLGNDAPSGSAKQFKDEFGFKTWYKFRIKGHKFLVLNSTLIKNYKDRPKQYAKQLRFIRKNADAKVVLVHHPPFQTNPKEYDDNDYFSWPIKTRNDILGLLKPGAFVFSGHTHRPFQVTVGGWHNIGVGTCCAPWRDGSKTYGILEIYRKAITYTEKLLPRF